MIDKDLTLSYNSEAKCPYCGFKDYGVMRHIEITYSTWVLDKDEEGGDSDES